MNAKEMSIFSFEFYKNVDMRLTFSASKLVLALICGMQNRRELNALLSKLKRFLSLEVNF